MPTGLDALNPAKWAEYSSCLANQEVQSILEPLEKDIGSFENTLAGFEKAVATDFTNVFAGVSSLTEAFANMGKFLATLPLTVQKGFSVIAQLLNSIGGAFSGFGAAFGGGSSSLGGLVGDTSSQTGLSPIVIILLVGVAAVVVLYLVLKK